MKSPWIPGLLVLLIPLAAARGQDDKRTRGRALAERIRHQQPAENTETAGTLKQQRTDGRRLTIPITVRVALDTNVWKSIYEARFDDGRRETLTVVNLPEEPPHFILHRAAGDGYVTESRPMRSADLFTPFANTDFWLVDLGMVFLHWPDQRWIKREVRRSRPCNVLESINPNPAPGAYRRVVTWLDEETGGIIRAEAYDDRDRLLKEFSPGSFARVGKRYELRDMEIRNDQRDSRTVLRFDVQDPNRLGIDHLRPDQK